MSTEPPNKKNAVRMASAAPVLAPKRRVPWPKRLPQRVLFCLACGSGEICARELCRSCYDAADHDDAYFAGAQERVLARDAHCSRVCGEVTKVPRRVLKKCTLPDRLAKWHCVDLSKPEGFNKLVWAMRSKA